MRVEGDRTPAPGVGGDHPTFCRLCEAVCGLVARVADGKVTDLLPDRANPHSQGHICIKGASMANITHDPDRVMTPLRRVGGPGEFEPVGWDEALDDIAARLRGIIDAHGPDAFATYIGNPAAFSSDGFMGTQWFLKAIGSSKFYTTGSQDSNARHVASHAVFGFAFRHAIPDLVHCDHLIVMGANPLVSHGSLLTAPRMRHDLDEIAKRGRIIVIDPRKTETAARYEHVPILPDSDVWLLAAMLATIFAEGLADEAFLSAHVEGWEKLRDRVAGFDIDEASERTAIPAEQMRQLARDFVAAPRAALYSRVGLCRGSFSTLTNILLDAVNICAGKFAKPGGSVFGAFPLGGGGKDLLDGYRVVRSSRLGDFAVVGGMMPCGILPTDIVTPGEGQVRAMLVSAGNPVLSAPGGDVLSEALEQLDLMFACDFYMNETNRHAHYILPSPTFLERDDVPVIVASHMVRPFLQYTPPVIPEVGEARAEFDVFCDILSRLGLEMGAGDGARPLDMFDLGMKYGPLGSAGLSVGELARHPHGMMLDLPLGYQGWEAFVGHEDGRLRLWHEIIEAEFARLDDASGSAPDARLRLFCQRELKSMNSWMHNVDKLVRSQKPVLLIHPDDAAARGVADGDLVRVTSRHGAVKVHVRVSEAVISGAVCYPHGWGHRGGWQTANEKGGANINILLGHGHDIMEPASGATFMDGVPVDVAPVMERA